ncbi:hypothetical protein ScalyP_jg1508 [Parmales sp. scaly parma]|nr:hypothetical protein ScalyP_jg1508 [Parmales sp. scaly parma]
MKQKYRTLDGAVINMDNSSWLSIALIVGFFFLVFFISLIVWLTTSGAIQRWVANDQGPRKNIPKKTKKQMKKKNCR